MSEGCLLWHPRYCGRDTSRKLQASLGCAEWSGKRCIQSLKVSRREGYRKRHGVFPDVRWRARFGNCDNVPAANHPGQRNRGGRAIMDSGDLRQRAVTYQEVMVAAERRIRHHRHIVLLAPQQNGRLNVTVVKTVRDLIGCAAMAVWNTEQIFHLANVEVGYTPSANLSRRAQLFESCYNGGELRAGDWRMQQIEIEMVGAETSQARLASTRDAISRHLVGLHLGDQEYAVALTGNHVTNELLGAAVAVITRRIDQRQ